MASAVLQCDLLEGDEIKEMRKQTVKEYESIDLLEFKNGTVEEINNKYKKACILWLKMFIRSKDCYNLKNNKTIIKIINMCNLICNNNDPYLSDFPHEKFNDTYGRDYFDHVLCEELKIELFVDDYDEEKYDEIQWSYNDIWWFNSIREDWKFMLDK